LWKADNNFARENFGEFKKINIFARSFFHSGVPMAHAADNSAEVLHKAVKFLCSKQKLV
jgi:hypothetical protein